MMTQSLAERVEYLEAENAELRKRAFGVPCAALRTEFNLTDFQARLLECLLAHELASHHALEDALWWDALGENEWPPNETLQVHMCRLRKKLPDWARPLSVWGVGYRLLPEARKRLKSMQAEASDEA